MRPNRQFIMNWRGNMEELKSRKLLKYVNEFWEAFNNKEKEEILQIILKMKDRHEKNFKEFIK